MSEQVSSLYQQLLEIIKKNTWYVDIWLIDSASLPPWQRRGVDVLKTSLLSYKRFRESRSDIQSAALTFITLLSLVPMLAFAFSVLKNLGFYAQLQRDVIAPLLDKWIPVSSAPELHNALQQMLVFVEQTDVSSLGTIGLVTIGYALIRLLTAVEAALNDLWGVKKQRSFARKITDYLSVAVIVPVVLLIAGSMGDWSTTVMEIQGVSSDYFYGWESFLRRALTVILVWIGFTFLYRFMPNEKILFGSAFRGGIFGGSVWMLINRILIELQIGVASYNAIYGGFSAFPIFMVWIYFSWWAILIGGSYAAAFQLNDQHRHYMLRSNVNFRSKETLAFQIAICLAEQYEKENTQIDIDILDDELGVELVVLDLVLSDLQEANICIVSKDKHVVLAKNSRRITVWDVLDAVKGNSDSVHTSRSDLFDAYQASIRQSEYNWSLYELMQKRIEERKVDTTMGLEKEFGFKSEEKTGATREDEVEA